MSPVLHTLYYESSGIRLSCMPFLTAHLSRVRNACKRLGQVDPSVRPKLLQIMEVLQLCVPCMHLILFQLRLISLCSCLAASGFQCLPVAAHPSSHKTACMDHKSCRNSCQLCIDFSMLQTSGPWCSDSCGTPMHSEATSAGHSPRYSQAEAACVHQDNQDSLPMMAVVVTRSVPAGAGGGDAVSGGFLSVRSAACLAGGSRDVRGGGGND